MGGGAASVGASSRFRELPPMIASLVKLTDVSFVFFVRVSVSACEVGEKKQIYSMAEE